MMEEQQNLLMHRLQEAFELIKAKPGKINDEDYQPLFREISELKQIQISARINICNFMSTVEIQENKPLITIQEKLPNIYICVTGELTINPDLHDARRKNIARLSQKQTAASKAEEDSHKDTQGSQPQSVQPKQAYQDSQEETEEREKLIYPSHIFGGLYPLTGKKWRQERNQQQTFEINSSEVFQKLLQFLSHNIPGFSRLSAVYRERIARCFKEKTFIQGQKLVTEGQPVSHAYIIREGLCKIYSERNPIQYSKKQMAVRNKRANSTSDLHDKPLLSNNRGYMSKTTNTLNLGLIGMNTWVADDLFILRDRLKSLQAGANNQQAVKMVAAMTANGMLQGQIKEDELIADYSVIPVTVKVSALEIAKQDISKIPKEFAQVLKRGAQQRNIWIEQRKHQLAQNSNRVSNLDPLHQVYDDAFKQISRRHPRATISTLAKLRDKQIQLATRQSDSGGEESQSPVHSSAKQISPSQTVKTAWANQSGLNNSIRKSYPNLLSQGGDILSHSPMATIGDPEGQILTKSDMKAALHHTLSAGRFSRSSNLQPELTKVTNIGGGYFNSHLQNSINGPNKSTSPQTKQQHLLGGGLNSNILMNQIPDGSLFNPNLYFDPNRVASRGSQRPNMGSRPQSQLGYNQQHPASILSASDFGYQVPYNPYSARTNTTSNIPLGLSASAQQLKVAFSRTIQEQQQQAIGDTMMLEALTSFNTHNASSNQTVSPLSGNKKILMENAATFKTSQEHRYLLPAYTKLQLAKKNRSKFTPNDPSQLIDASHHRKQMQMARKFEMQAKEKHKGFKVGMFKKVKTVKTEYANYYTKQQFSTTDNRWSSNSLQRGNRPPSPNPADEWARSKGFRLQDYQKIKQEKNLRIGLRGGGDNHSYQHLVGNINLEKVRKLF